MQPQSSTASQRVSIAFPVFNEMHTLAPIVTSSVEVLAKAGIQDWEIVIVDDGSTDDTPAVIRTLQDRFPALRVISHDRRCGFAAVQQSCYDQCQMDWVFLLPADGQVPAETLLDFLPLSRDYDIVCGTVQRSQKGWKAELASRTYHFLVEALFGLDIGRFGACLLARREILAKVQVQARTPVAMTELLVRARQGGARITGIQVNKQPRFHGRGLGGMQMTSSLRILMEVLHLRWQVGRAAD